MNKNYRINEILGAKFFKKCVFRVEKIKFKIIDKFFPNSLKIYETKLKKSFYKKLNKIENEDERKVLIKNYHEKILVSRKEFNNKKNRNYHINIDDPNDFINYIKKNRKIHIKGLIKNGFCYLGIIPLFIIPNSTLSIIGYIILSYNTISTLINFECVNLQNYNLKRFEESREKLIKIKGKKQERDLKKYGEISKVVSKALNDSIEIPKPKDIIDNITTKEQLIELRKLLNTYNSYENNIDIKELKKTRR